MKIPRTGRSGSNRPLATVVECADRAIRWCLDSMSRKIRGAHGSLDCASPHESEIYEYHIGSSEQFPYEDQRQLMAGELLSTEIELPASDFDKFPTDPIPVWYWAYMREPTLEDGLPMQLM